MLGTDISLIEPPGFFLGKYHDLARLSGKWFEHLTKPLLQLSSTADWLLSGAGKKTKLAGRPQPPQVPPCWHERRVRGRVSPPAHRPRCSLPPCRRGGLWHGWGR